jgi:hypothetical protein
MWFQAAQAAVSEEVGAISSLSHVGMLVFLGIIGTSRIIDLARDFGVIGNRRKELSGNGNGSANAAYRPTLTSSESRMKEIFTAVMEPERELLVEIRDCMRELVSAHREESLAQRVAEQLKRDK